MKKAEKKLGKIKTLKKEATVIPDGTPMELKMTTYFQAPNTNATKMEFNGMVLQQEIFNGTEGITKAMNQTGGSDITKYTEEEVIAKKKTSAAFSEYSLLCNTEDVELLGIENKDGIDHYVIQYNLGETTKTDYHNKKTGLKAQTNSLEVTEQRPQGITAIRGE